MQKVLWFIIILFYIYQQYLWALETLKTHEIMKKKRSCQGFLRVLPRKENNGFSWLKMQMMQKVLWFIIILFYICQHYLWALETLKTHEIMKKKLDLYGYLLGFFFFFFLLIDKKKDILIAATKRATHGIQNIYSYHRQTPR